MALRPTLFRIVGSAAALVALAGCGASSATGPVTTATTAGATTAAPTTPATAAPTTPATAVPATTVPATTVPATTVPATTAAPTTAAGPAPCTSAQLSLSVTNPLGAAGSSSVSLNLLNSGSSTCTLSGFPGVSYVTGDNGTQVGNPAQRNGAASATVTVAPGHAGVASLRLVNPSVFDPAACQPTTTTGFRVYPPGQTAAGFVSSPGHGCASTTLPSSQLTIGPVVAGPSQGGI